jgi:hypothetical protein
MTGKKERPGSTVRVFTGLLFVFAALAFSDIRVLFVGNSYTHQNGGVYTIVAGLDAASSDPVVIDHDHVWKGGESLDYHWSSGYAQDSLNNRTYDYLVIQPFWWTNTGSGVGGFHRHMRLFDSAAVQSGTESIIYQPWPFNTSSKQSRYAEILDACGSIATELGIGIARAAEAWHVSETARPDLDLYVSDNVHPTYAGSYLASCCIYIALTGKNPIGTQYTYGGLVSQADAEFLQRTAWTVMNAATALHPAGGIAVRSKRQISSQGSVHNLFGQRVGTPMHRLVRGLYVANAAGERRNRRLLQLR